jgi:hypothetical protein
MTLIALGMNGLLALLLVAALGFGIRLDRKLKGVRDGQLAFTGAVAELNAATARAQAGLADLRAATDEATDNLGGRLARAREAADRLEKLLVRAESLPAQAPAVAREGPEGGLAALLASVAEAAETISPAPVARRERAPLSERAPRPVRARPVVDDDLFEDAGGR